MPTTRRSATVAAPPAEVWRAVSDPHQLPRWWPRLERVEAVDGRGFTEVLRSERGNLVRADFRFARREKPRAVGWTQEVEGTPFARVFAANDTEITLEPSGGGTVVRIALAQKLRGASRLGGLLVRRASRRTLDDALRALAGLYEA